MKNYFKKITTIFIFSLLGMQVFASQTPQEIVKKTTDEMVARVKIEQPYYATQPERMTKGVDEVLSSIVDIDRIAKGVMGKYYKTATPVQQKKFVTVFRQSLMQTYARGIANYDNNKIEIMPPRPGEPVDPENTPVRMKLYLKDNDFIDIIYTMFQAPNGDWKLKNVIINGINLGLTFRNQFSESMQTNHNDIDKVISTWTSEVKTEKTNKTASNGSAANAK